MDPFQLTASEQISPPRRHFWLFSSVANQAQEGVREPLRFVSVASVSHGGSTIYADPAASENG